MSAVRGYAEVAADLRDVQGAWARYDDSDAEHPDGIETLQEFRWRVEREAAALLAAVDATLPDCPTCGGTAVVITPDSVGKAFFAVMDQGRGAGAPHLNCPDCLETPGKVSVAQMAATYARVWKFADEERHQHGGEYGEGWRACIDHLRAVKP